MPQNQSNPSNQTVARRISVLFLVGIGVVVAAILAAILLTPYDSGVLAGSALSGNNLYGGKVVATNDYIFFADESGVSSIDRATKQITPVHTGAASYLNPYDGWLYFVENGAIFRMAYNGTLLERVGEASDVAMMSVNGLWIYYTDTSGALHKVRTDGAYARLLTDRVKVTAFEAANRLVLFTDGSAIYRMNTDGSDERVLVEAGGVDRMLYTLDDLFYASNGTVHRVQSVEAGQSDGTDFSGVQAAIFTYNTDSNGRGQIFYWQEDALRVRKLKSVEDEKEEDRLLVEAADVVDLYSIDDDLYYHDAAGALYRVVIHEKTCTVEPVA